MNTRTVLVALLGLATLTACGSSSPTGSGSTATSGTTGTPTGTSLATSHNAGRDCTGCHNFGAAGTVYRTDGVTPYPGAVVRLTTASAGGGSVVATLTTDATGNFHTPASLPSGLYADVRGSGATRSMTAVVTRGGCNACHGSGSRILAD
jgi:hypothetical protein